MVSKKEYSELLKVVKKTVKKDRIWLERRADVTYISDGHWIFAIHNMIYDSLFYELGVTLQHDDSFIVCDKQHDRVTKNENNTMLSKMFIDNMDYNLPTTETAKYTTVKIQCGDKLVDVFKTENNLIAIDSRFIDMVKSTPFFGAMCYSCGDKIYSPIMFRNDIYGALLLPINCNVREVLENLL